ncbi:hypothetical protein ARMSODRAFT_967661 [Armillaria solidipes]|uniref:Uncharacterized protein n=1 Tax=Armillaria solidipes TaxID=1076256 RepID=A0A2H3AHU8_9AGAR|nr:hypothetical protein ARMSODRAFT_967661 [Armillaria solidipes]
MTVHSFRVYYAFREGQIYLTRDGPYYGSTHARRSCDILGPISLLETDTRQP